MRPNPSARRGYALIEVLVVFIIVSGVLAVILPALTAGREAARRTQCVNSLRQLTLALQNYQESYGMLPPGVVNPTGPVANVAEDLHIGWVVQLLPYIEQGGIAMATDTDFSVYAPENATASTPRLRTLNCPSDPVIGAFGYGVSSYAGSQNDVEAPIDVDNRGVFFLNSAVRPVDVADGLSNTFFLGEKVMRGPDLGWMSGTRSTLRNTGTRLNAPPAPPPSPPGTDPDLWVGGFGSHHAGGANFGLGDGSVRFIRETIHPHVYRALGARDDGEMIGGDRY